VKKKTPEQVQFERDFVLAAGMSGDTKTVSHVRQILQDAGIRCTYEGSVLYDLYVERTQVERALELLRAERASGWHILFPDEHTTA
jgi:hypothetical protein